MNAFIQRFISAVLTPQPGFGSFESMQFIRDVLEDLLPLHYQALPLNHLICGGARYKVAPVGPLALDLYTLKVLYFQMY